MSDNQLSEMLGDTASATAATNNSLERLRALKGKSTSARPPEEKEADAEVALVTAQEMGWTAGQGTPRRGAKRRKADAEPTHPLYVRIPISALNNFNRYCTDQGLTNVKGVMELLGKLPEGYRPGDN